MWSSKDVWHPFYVQAFKVTQEKSQAGIVCLDVVVKENEEIRIKVVGWQSLY